ncbi:MAG: N-acetylmuramoyl-L-alanine amidase [Phenylobacterium sp.]|nr:N-acetylmuramoyl-L-alanine amidase [Phenylobacterium sp.]MDB5461851.1 N-acetylmuramoyl-L-alanine amidase [Phenylobacterium sp.]
MLAGAGRIFVRNRVRAVFAAAAVAAGVAAVIAASHAAASIGGLLKVRLGGDEQQTRLVMDIDQAASAKLLSDGSADGHAVLLLPTVSAQGGLQGSGQGLVKAWAIEQTPAGARLQMDLAASARVRARFLLPPADGIDHYRYVVDIVSQAGAVRLISNPNPGAAVGLQLRPQIAPSQVLPVSLKKVVVIDPGHGGHDPGATGALGFEKDVNLAAALALKARLERSSRYRVVLTRQDDTYVPLETRVRIAQRAGADLFISLHSDSGPDATLRGASVYTLSDKASNRAARFVSRDDWFMKASLTGDRGVSDILFDLTQRATKNRSAAFAQTLVGRIEGKAPLLRRSQRDAGFMVLLAPDVPAVLLEMGFVTNPDDEEFLRDPQRRGRLMNAVGDSIDDYFAQATRLASR